MTERKREIDRESDSDSDSTTRRNCAFGIPLTVRMEAEHRSVRTQHANASISIGDASAIILHVISINSISDARLRNCKHANFAY